MSVNQNAPQESPCRNNCGMSIHFSEKFRGQKGGWIPLIWATTPQGPVEVPHQCPKDPRNAQAPAAQPAASGAYSAQAPPPAGTSGPAAGSSSPSVTQLLLAEQQKANVILERIAVANEGMFALLKSLHPDRTEEVPQSETQAASGTELPPEEYQSADELDQQPPQ